MIRLMVDWENRRIMSEEDFQKNIFPGIVESYMCDDEEFSEWVDENYTTMEILDQGLTKEHLWKEFKRLMLQDATENAQEEVKQNWGSITIEEL